MIAYFATTARKSDKLAISVFSRNLNWCNLANAKVGVEKQSPQCDVISNWRVRGEFFAIFQRNRRRRTRLSPPLRLTVERELSLSIAGRTGAEPELGPTSLDISASHVRDNLRTAATR
ncbi:hypothetical protein Zmor_002311 [Zophobas morio]|uniref:Uncharacterized protein n=1 Tax=Zophobas morio TaxID=2755281 RepID=A0AA38J4L4_9CUCU|nr:hypothetical protein Zmor_002311 [Zophobas morio]